MSFGNAFESNSERDAAVENPGAPDPEAVAGLADDLNVSKFFEVIHRLSKEADESVDPVARASAGRRLSASLKMIGLELGPEFSRRLDEVVHEILLDQRIAARTAAKERRDFATADRIRDELKDEGILLEDGPGGTTWRRA